jgi:hypothetical protein
VVQSSHSIHRPAGHHTTTPLHCPHNPPQHTTRTHTYPPRPPRPPPRGPCAGETCLTWLRSTSVGRKEKRRSACCGGGVCRGRRSIEVSL